MCDSQSRPVLRGELIQRGLQCDCLVGTGVRVVLIGGRAASLLSSRVATKGSISMSPHTIMTAPPPSLSEIASPLSEIRPPKHDVRVVICDSRTCVAEERSREDPRTMLGGFRRYLSTDVVDCRSAFGRVAPCPRTGEMLLLR